MFRIRYQQQYRQLQNRIIPSAGTIATYIERDGLTGQRTIETADGGRYLAQYISNSQPSGIMPLIKAGTIGLPGYISQKPY